MRPVLVLLFLLWTGLAQAAPAVVIYPQPEAVSDKLTRYPQKLLEMALAKAGGQYQMRLSDVKMQQARGMALLKEGKGVDIVNYMTSDDRERDFLPIRIATDKGLIGNRLLLVRKDQLDKFRRIVKVQDLKKLGAGQREDWPDVEILRANGFTVHTTSNYELLFKLLEAGGIDYFPRNVVEIWDEAQQHASHELVVEPTIMLRYPAETYFFVNRNNSALAAAVKLGLQRMIADGSFDKLFEEYHHDVLAKANLKQRRVFELLYARPVE